MHPWITHARLCTGELNDLHVFDPTPRPPTAQRRLLDIYMASRRRGASSTSTGAGMEIQVSVTWTCSTPS